MTKQEQEEARKQRTFGFIGLLAMVLYHRSIKIDYYALSDILKDKLNDAYDPKGGGMVQGVIGASNMWSKASQGDKVCKAIDCVYVNHDDESIQRYKEHFGKELNVSKVFTFKTYTNITQIVDMTYRHWFYYQENAIEAVEIL